MSSIRFRDFIDKLRATYWFLPAIMTALAATSAIILFWADQTLPNNMLQNCWYIFQLSSILEARSVLTSIGETTLGVTGIVFSIILVPLSISATQYGSIVLRAFLRDLTTQFALGAFTSTTFYCLVLLMALRNATNGTALQLSVSVAVYLLLVSLLLLIYFFHHVADSLQASAVIEHVSNELQSVIKEGYSIGPTAPSDQTQVDAEATRQKVAREGEVVTSTREGYVRAVDYNRLIEVGTKHDTTLYLETRPGDFISPGSPLVRAFPPPHEKDFASAVNRAYMLGKNRTVFQDPEFGIYLIVTIAVRALSPAINDPNTPLLCLNRSGAALAMLAERKWRSPFYYDEDKQLRVISDPVSFERLTDVAFNQIRQYGRTNAEVLIMMLKTIKTVAAHTHSELQRKALRKHAMLIERESHIGLPSEYDQQRVHESYEETSKSLEPSYERCL